MCDYCGHFQLCGHPIPLDLRMNGVNRLTYANSEECHIKFYDQILLAIATNNQKLRFPYPMNGFVGWGSSLVFTRIMSRESTLSIQTPICIWNNTLPSHMCQPFYSVNFINEIFVLDKHVCLKMVIKPSHCWSNIYKTYVINFLNWATNIYLSDI